MPSTSSFYIETRLPRKGTAIRDAARDQHLSPGRRHDLRAGTCDLAGSGATRVPRHLARGQRLPAPDGAARPPDPDPGLLDRPLGAGRLDLDDPPGLAGVPGPSPPSRPPAQGTVHPPPHL